MAFKIVNETYTTLPEQNPERFGYVEGYTSNTVGETYLILNTCFVPDDEMVDAYKRFPGLEYFGLKAGKEYGTGVRLSRKQVLQLIWELIKWLVKGA